MSTTAELFTIGQLARRTGVPARTIRFWSDAGLVPPAARSGSGYRLYALGAVARLNLVRTLRELGLPSVVPGFEWLIAALRAGLSQTGPSPAARGEQRAAKRDEPGICGRRPGPLR